MLGSFLTIVLHVFTKVVHNLEELLVHFLLLIEWLLYLEDITCQELVVLEGFVTQILDGVPLKGSKAEKLLVFVSCLLETVALSLIQDLAIVFVYSRGWNSKLIDSHFLLHRSVLLFQLSDVVNLLLSCKELGLLDVAILLSFLILLVQVENLLTLFKLDFVLDIFVLLLHLSSFLGQLPPIEVDLLLSWVDFQRRL